jgi:hypothetical protein
MDKADEELRGDVIIELDADDADVEGHAGRVQFSARDDEERLKALLAERDRIRVRLDPRDDDESDAEGHAATAAAVVLYVLDDEDDTEGHAISIHFPTAKDARAFRNRLIVTGALVGSVALAGVATGIAQAPAPGATTTAPAAQAQDATDGWQHSGIAGSATANANAQTDGWQHSGVAGSATANEAAAREQANQAYAERLQGQADLQAANAQTDGWQHSGVAGSATANEADLAKANAETDGWIHSGTAGTGDAGEASDEAGPSKGGLTPR